MLRNTLMGLDELLLEVPDQIERRYLGEAIKCYHIEAYRAAVLLSWIVTARNLEKKLEQLAGEDGEARNYWTGIDDKKKNEQSYEEDLLNACRALGILDDQEAKELKHFRDTRNWCAHPTSYEPTAEKVRHCMRSAVEYALSRPIVRGFAYIRYLAEDKIKDQFFLPSRDAAVIDTYVKEMLDKLRSDLHPALAKQMVRTFQDPNATATTQENTRLFLSSMVRQSPSDHLQGLTQAIETLLDSDPRSAAVILSSRPEPFDHLSTLGRDRLISLVIAEVTDGTAPDELMIRALEEMVNSGALDDVQLQGIGDSLHAYIYDLYPELENKDAPFFANVLLERLEWDFTRLDSGERGTVFARANPAALFIRRLGLHSFESQPLEYRQRLADAMAVAAGENAFDAIPIFSSAAGLDDEWLQLLLDGLAHHFSEQGTFYEAKMLTVPLTEWVNRGHDLTLAWKDFLRRALDEYEQESQQIGSPYRTMRWYPRSQQAIREIEGAFGQVAQKLQDRGQDAGPVVNLLECFHAVHPEAFITRL